MVKKIRDYLSQFNRNLWVMALGWFVSAMGFSVSIPFISIYFHSVLGLSLSQIGLFFGAIALSRSLFQVIGGELSDHMERKTLMVFAQVMRGFAFLLLAFFVYYDWGFWPVASSLFINSAFGAIFQPTANAMITDILPKEKRLDGYAVTRSAMNLGWAAGPALGGFMAAESYGLLFLISSLIMITSGTVIWVLLKPEKIERNNERFKFKDLAAVKDDKNFAWHCALSFLLYIVVAQMIATFSVYAVEMVGISQNQLGFLYTWNGLLVFSLQIPITRFMKNYRLTRQLALGGFLYAIGFGFVGFCPGFFYFAIAITVITLGEVVMSPPAMVLTSRLAPKNRTGRYMGIHGLFVASGWSLGPLYGGIILDKLGQNYILSWMTISVMALLSSIGYLLYTRRLPEKYNKKEEIQ